MINEISDKTIEFTKSLVGPGLCLEGIKEVTSLEGKTMADCLPAISFEYTGQTDIDFQGNYLEVSPRFKFTLITSGFDEFEACKREHLSLVCKLGNGGKISGFLIAIAKFACTCIDLGGGIKLLPVVDVGSASFALREQDSGPWKFITEKNVRFVTQFRRHQF